MMSATENITNEAQGNPLTTKSQVLETGAAVGQVSDTHHSLIPVVEDLDQLIKGRNHRTLHR